VAESQEYNQAQKPNGAFDDRIMVVVDGPNAATFGTGPFNNLLDVDGYRKFYPTFPLERRFFYVAEQRESPFKWELGVGYHSTISAIERESVIWTSAGGGSPIDFSDDVDLYIYNTIPSAQLRRSLPGRMLAQARGFALF
jgi:hypothetical protein